MNSIRGRQSTDTQHIQSVTQAAAARFAEPLPLPPEYDFQADVQNDLYGTAFLFNGTSDCWGLYPSQEDGARSDEFCLEFLKARSGMQKVGTVFNLQGSIEDYSWELMGIQGQTESLEERRLFRDEVKDHLTVRGGRWTAQQIADEFKVSNERARKTLIKLFELRCGVDRVKRSSAGGRPLWCYFSTASHV